MTDFLYVLLIGKPGVGEVVFVWKISLGFHSTSSEKFALPFLPCH